MPSAAGCGIIQGEALTGRPWEEIPLNYPKVDLMSPLLFLLLPSCSQAQLQRHDHGDSCGCTMLEAIHPFTLDCTAAGAAGLAEAEAVLKACAPTREACAALNENSGVQQCQTAFFTLQAHHDHCDHGAIAQSHDRLIHEYESVCHSCEIARAYDPSRHSNCPTVDCSDQAPALLALHTLNGSCTSEQCCSDADERAAFELISAYHDQCEEGAVPTAVEHAMHDFEISCDDALCNMVDASYDATACPHDDERTEHGHVALPPPPNDAPWPVWADTLLAMGAWLIAFAGVLLALLLCIARDVRDIKALASRRGGHHSPIFSSLSMQDAMQGASGSSEMATANSGSAKPEPQA